MMRLILVLLALPAAAAAQVSLTHVGTVDVSVTSNAANPEYIGNNPTAVAWNGTDLWVAGFNNLGTAGTTAIIRVSNALTAPVFGTTFGVNAGTPSSRGYTGLDLVGSTLLASYDPGASSPVGITAWDLNGAPLWAKAARGSSGVAFDPGWFTIDSGAAWTTFGHTRRSLQNLATGVDIYDSTNGMVIDPSPSPGTTWRDIAFDAVTGDVWLRMANKVIAASRVDGNTLTNQRVLVDATLAATTIAQNIAYVRQLPGEVVFWNFRTSGATGQPFANAIRCNEAQTGASLAIDWGSFTAIAGAGAYDFSYDPATKTLAISDFSARAVYIFQVTIYAPYGSGCLGSGGMAPVLSASGSAHAGGAITYRLEQAAPLSIGFFAFGDSAASGIVPFPYFCPLLISPLLLIEGFFVTPPGPPGSGAGQFTIPIPLSASGISLTGQGFVMENGFLDQLVSSNAIFVVTM